MASYGGTADSKGTVHHGPRQTVMTDRQMGKARQRFSQSRKTARRQGRR